MIFNCRGGGRRFHIGNLWQRVRCARLGSLIDWSLARESLCFGIARIEVMFAISWPYDLSRLGVATACATEAVGECSELNANFAKWFFFINILSNHALKRPAHTTSIFIHKYLQLARGGSKLHHWSVLHHILQTIWQALSRRLQIAIMAIKRGANHLCAGPFLWHFYCGVLSHPCVTVVIVRTSEKWWPIATLSMLSVGWCINWWQRPKRVVCPLVSAA